MHFLVFVWKRVLHSMDCAVSQKCHFAPGTYNVFKAHLALSLQGQERVVKTFVCFVVY